MSLVGVCVLASVVGVPALLMLAALVQGARAARSVRVEALRSGAEPQPAPDRRS
ncbi:hypothetical protein HL658_32520 [Azospirillum sp. RWY-5-1]|uniref:Uncharacterized protein n=1 Tax=Azospirillum oleiclasticum TaxID=2735135 RepID=A0ABX2TJU0_9PROT|nr:hypothetical protein [Azospirillum oleiclasticum]NYZ17293.1 hypothetical protein [Azospirillum oleiclasticum]NYZ23423.1 hypothetical protein [Azospirillum oleiclasticum]